MRMVAARPTIRFSSNFHATGRDRSRRKLTAGIINPFLPSTMKTSLDGLLSQSAGLLDEQLSPYSKYYAYSLRELAKNIRELALRQREGNPAALDEFLALYDLESPARVAKGSS